MKHFNRKQTIIVQGNSAEDFQTKLNEALNQVAEGGRKYDLQFNMQLGFCAFVVYEESIEIPETTADRYELNGEEYRCSECPMYRPSTDKRVKYTVCGHGCRRRSANDYACDWFYEAMERGEVLPI